MTNWRPGRRLLLAACVLYACTGPEADGAAADADTLRHEQPPGSLSPDTMSAAPLSPEAEAFVAAALRVLDFLRGDAEFTALNLADTVTLQLAPQSGGGQAHVAAFDLRDPGAWRVMGDAGLVYPFAPPAELTHRAAVFGRHVRCFEYDLAAEFPELAQLPHVGTRYEPADRMSCLQTWNLTFVFEAGTMPPRLVAVVYDQWEW
jgi:hypothetical protein